MLGSGKASLGTAASAEHPEATTESTLGSELRIFITHSHRHIPPAQKSFPSPLSRDSLWISELCKLKEKRERAHPGPREEGMLDENAQVSSEGVACADGSVYQLHWLESLPVHSTKAVLEA